MDKIKLGARFYLTTILTLLAGTVGGFFLAGILLDSGLMFLNLILGFSWGILIAAGILLLAPSKDAADGSIAGYTFWPGLTLGSTLAIGSTDASKTTILLFSFSAIAGFAVILIAFIYLDFREKKGDG